MIAFPGKFHFVMALGFTLTGNGFSFDPWLFFGLWLGSYLPDIDTPSTLGVFIPIWLFTNRNIHRKYTHSLVALLVVTLLSAMVNFSFAFGIFTAYSLHLLTDGGTKVSVPYIFWPFRYNKDHWYYKKKFYR